MAHSSERQVCLLGPPAEDPVCKAAADYSHQNYSPGGNNNVSPELACVELFVSKFPEKRFLEKRNQRTRRGGYASGFCGGVTEMRRPRKKSL